MLTPWRVIETRYAGVLFRSRLEARWAVFFDSLKIQWHYEPEGFESAAGMRYLPDFFLPRLHCCGLYAEIKPGGDPFEKARALATSGARILLLTELSAGPFELTGAWHDGELTSEQVGFASKYLPGGRNGEEYRLSNATARDGFSYHDLRINHALSRARSARFEFQGNRP
jgi:hypothetical protein